ncbi:hypothetical protein LTS18_004416, partial [Coniosporium uncinatum]
YNHYAFDFWASSSSQSVAVSGTQTGFDLASLPNSGVVTVFVRPKTSDPAKLHLGQKPIVLDCSQDAHLDITKTVVAWEPFVKNEVCTALLTLRDGNGFRYTSSKAEVVVSQVDGPPHFIVLDVTHHRDGTYLLRYLPSAEAAAMRITVDGSEIPGSPFSFPSSPSAFSHAVASGSGLFACTLNQAATFTITCYDMAGNPSFNGVQTPEIFVYNYNTPDLFPAQVVQAPDAGTYTVSYTVTNRHDNIPTQIEIWVNGKAVSATSSPSAHVADVTVPASYTFAISGLDVGKVVPTSSGGDWSGSFVVQTKRNNDTFTANPASFTFQTSYRGPQTPIEFHVLPDERMNIRGDRQVQFRVLVEGPIEFSVLYEGVERVTHRIWGSDAAYSVVRHALLNPVEKHPQYSIWGKQPTPKDGDEFDRVAFDENKLSYLPLVLPGMDSAFEQGLIFQFQVSMKIWTVWRNFSSELFQITLAGDPSGSVPDGVVSNLPRLIARFQPGPTPENGAIIGKWIIGNSADMDSTFRSDDRKRYLTYIIAKSRNDAAASITVLESGKFIGTSTSDIPATAGSGPDPRLLGLRLTCPEKFTCGLRLDNITTIPSSFRSSYDGSSTTDMAFSSTRSPAVFDYLTMGCFAMILTMGGYPNFRSSMQTHTYRPSRIISLTNSAMIFRNGDADKSTYFVIQQVPQADPGRGGPSNFRITSILLKIGNANNGRSPGYLDFSMYARLTLPPGQRGSWAIHARSPIVAASSLQLGAADAVLLTFVISGNNVSIFENGKFIASGESFLGIPDASFGVGVKNCDVDFVGVKMWPGFRRMSPEEITKARADEDRET